jgi:putative transposase
LGFKVNRKRIQRYMRDMGIQVFCPGPNLSKRNKAQYVYPYLLRNVTPAHWQQHSIDQAYPGLFYVLWLTGTNSWHRHHSHV